jgi:hypothetical protein
MEAIMRRHLLGMTVAVYLSLTVLGCSKKPDQPADNSTANNSMSNAPAPAPAAPEQPAAPKIVTVTVPAGTTLTVKLGQQLGSKISQAGETFTATVASPVDVNGSTIIPAGATANGTVVDAKPLGRFKGGASLEVQLTSITIHGKEHAIQTAAVTQTEKGKGKRTAVLAGGGAGLGAVVGALAGGGKGAAIGALAGAGAGGAGAAFTGNKEIVLPAESALSFQLSQALEVKEEVKE